MAVMDSLHVFILAALCFAGYMGPLRVFALHSAFFSPKTFEYQIALYKKGHSCISIFTLVTRLRTFYIAVTSEEKSHHT